MSTEQQQALDAILRQAALPAGSDVGEQRRLLAELTSAQPLPPGVTVTAAGLGGVRTAEITIDAIEPRHVILYFHGGVYAIDDAIRLTRQAATVDVTPGVPHVFQAYSPILDEAAAALNRAGQLLSAHLTAAEQGTT